MKTITSNITNEIIIKNSRFIALLIEIDNPDINKYLEKAKKNYPKANHYTYAYIYNDVKKCSDDREPTGTAGAPILNVLEHENLNNILVIVVRYFGGIKLGAGGLIRAYTKAVTEALKQIEAKELEQGYKVEIIFNYEDEKQINYILQNSNIINKSYKEEITYTTLINKEVLDKLYNYKTNILEEIYIEK